MYLLLLCHSSRENISLQGNMSGTTIGQPKNVYTYFLMLYKNADGVEEERGADNFVWPTWHRSYFQPNLLRGTLASCRFCGASGRPNCLPQGACTHGPQPARSFYLSPKAWRALREPEFPRVLPCQGVGGLMAATACSGLQGKAPRCHEAWCLQAGLALLQPAKPDLKPLFFFFNWKIFLTTFFVIW